MRGEQLDLAERRHPQLDARAAQLGADDALLDDAAVLRRAARGSPPSWMSGCSNAIASTRRRSSARSSAAPGAGRPRRSTSALPRPETPSLSLTIASATPVVVARMSASAVDDAVERRARPRSRAGAGRRPPRTAAGSRSWCRTRADADRRRRAGRRASARRRARASWSRRARGGSATRSGISARICASTRGRSSSFAASATRRAVVGRDHVQASTGLARDDARQQPEVVLDDALGNRPPRHVDHPQPRVAEQEQQEQHALLERLHRGSALGRVRARPTARRRSTRPAG